MAVSLHDVPLERYPLKPEGTAAARTSQEGGE